MVNRVIVGIDFSPASRQALARAATLAKQFQAPLVGMHVIEHPALSLFRVYAPLGDPTWFQELEPRADTELKSWLAPYPGALVLVRNGSPAEELVKEADPQTLLVVGQVGHSAIDNLLFGSTAARVVRHAPCDVLVVRANLKF